MEQKRILKATERIVLVTGRHQNQGEDKKALGALAAAADERIEALQRGKDEAIHNGLIEQRRQHPETYITLTEKGQTVYEALETIQETLLEE